MQSSHFSPSALTVEKTVKPLKTAENVVTSERNQNGPKQRGGGKRPMRKSGGQTQKGGNRARMKGVVSYALMRVASNSRVAFDD
jgi:hypothetical protein